MVVRVLHRLAVFMAVIVAHWLVHMSQHICTARAEEP
jgi:hypothetical protein